MKKTVFLILAVILVVGGVFTISSKDFSSTPKTYCPFCDPKVIEYQNFYEDDVVIGLYDYKPVEPGHCLIIPKRHVPRFEDLTKEEISQIGALIKVVNKAVSKVYGTTGYILLEKNGKEAFQEVMHVHFHYMPRKAGDLSFFAFIYKYFSAHLGKAISPAEMRENVEKISKAIKEEAAYAKEQGLNVKEEPPILL